MLHLHNRSLYFKYFLSFYLTKQFQPVCVFYCIHIYYLKYCTTIKKIMLQICVWVPESDQIKQGHIDSIFTLFIQFTETGRSSVDITEVLSEQTSKVYFGLLANFYSTQKPGDQPLKCRNISLVVYRFSTFKNPFHTPSSTNNEYLGCILRCIYSS